MSERETLPLIQNGSALASRLCGPRVVAAADREGGGDFFELYATPPADGGDPVPWHLPATLSVNTSGDAGKIVELYRRRWKIEEWHRILETGCKIEQAAHRRRMPPSRTSRSRHAGGLF